MLLADLLKSGDENRVIVAAFPLEDTSKTLEDVFPKSWVNQEEMTTIPLLLVPKQLAREVCTHMWNQGNEFLKNWYSEHPDAGTNNGDSSS